MRNDFSLLTAGISNWIWFLDQGYRGTFSLADEMSGNSELDDVHTKRFGTQAFR
jgi:hypothetical protein